MAIFNPANEALSIWRALKPMIDAEIKTLTKNCVRRKLMTVTTVPSNNLVGVTDPANGQQIFVPYVSTLASYLSTLNVTVWVEWSYSMTNAVVVARGNGRTS